MDLKVVTEHKSIPLDVGETTQLSNAWRLRIDHSNDLRHVDGVGWIVWDGLRWAADEAGALQLCERVTRRLYAEVEDDTRACEATKKRIKDDKDATPGMQDAAKKASDVAQARLMFARRSQSVRSFSDMLEHAKTFPEMRLKADEIDAKPKLLTCANGTIDLTTGELLEPRRTDFITRASQVTYSRSEEVSRWHNFLMDALGDEESVEYLRQFAGYCLHGDASQELFLFVHGPPGNGKSTLVEALCSCLGPELTISIDFETLCRKTTTSQKYDTARMRGIRMVRTSESDKSQRLDEGLVCRWVGGEVLRGKALYKDPFDFMPQFKLALSVNGKPRINPDRTETGIWRRMICVPFLRNTLSDAERDSSIKKFWTDPKGGVPTVLRWAVTGSVDYVKAGRLPTLPDLLSAARDRYREECDVVHQFMNECVVSDPKGMIQCEELRKRFVMWCSDQGDQYPLNAQQLASRLTGDPWRATKKRERIDNAHVHVWRGIRRLTIDDNNSNYVVDQCQNTSPKVEEDDDIERDAIVNMS